MPPLNPSPPRRTAVTLWLLVLAAAGAILAFHARFTTDLTAFLPAAASRPQQLLIDQLRDGVAARLILVAVEARPGAQTPTRELARLSRALARRLSADPRFVYVNNGESRYGSAERERLFRHRYLLSPAVVPGRFTADSLRQALQDDLELLASPVGAALEAQLPADPTGEALRAAAPLAGRQPATRHGVWFSANGRRALLVAQTRAPGFDFERQEAAVGALRTAFADAGPAAGARLLMTGPGVFAVEAKRVIHADSWRLSVIASVLAVTVLFYVYRSPRTVALGLLPVLTGLSVGVAAVALGFGTVHGITLAFGATLVGEAVDYPSYLFAQVGADETVADALDRVWPTLRLAVLTTVFGGLAMLLSDFTGLAQLGLLSMTGVLVAGLTTRWLLPALAPAEFGRGKLQALPWVRARPAGTTGGAAHRTPAETGRARTASAGAGKAEAGRDRTDLAWTDSARTGQAETGPDASRAAPVTRPGRTPLRRGLAALAALATLAAALYVAGRHDRLWDDDLRSLSPVSPAMQRLDAELRAELGAPDVRTLVVFTAPNREAVLRESEAAARWLDDWVREGRIQGYETAAQLLPSRATQERRRAALPPPAELRAALAEASARLPFRSGVFQPFLQDVERTRRGDGLSAADYAGSGLGLKINALLFESGGEWVALAPLRGVREAELQDGALAAALQADAGGSVFLLDLKAESDRMVAAYRGQSLRLSALGALAITLVLAWGLRGGGGGRAVAEVLAPVAAALVLTVAALLLLGERLTLFHLVSLLLVLGIGLNYALFFHQPAADAAERDRTLLALGVCVFTTLTAFGALALSGTPVLHAIGLTVSLGALLSLLLAGVWVWRR